MEIAHCSRWAGRWKH